MFAALSEQDIAPRAGGVRSGTVGHEASEANGPRREPPMILLRRLLGDVLRRQRQRQGRTLREVSSSARVSLGYLSEVERGQKEASSELLSAICDALDVRMSELMREVSDELALAELARSAAATPSEIQSAICRFWNCAPISAPLTDSTAPRTTRANAGA